MDMPSFPHAFPFDPTYGHDWSSLLAMPAPPPPADFEAFWRAMQREAQAIAPRPTLERLPDPRPGLQLFTVAFDSLDGQRVGGWLTRPADQPVRRGLVLGHGYGGREAPDLDVPVDGAVCIQPCARGFHRSASPRYPGTSAFHVIHGIDDRRTYSHLGSCADLLWCAANALLELELAASARLEYLASSFGGGIGAMALPWDARFTRAALEVPSFGNHDFRLSVPCVGSGEAVRLYVQRRPAARQVLRYFDSASSATFLRVPVHFTNALFDPAVPPPGQFAVYNAAAGGKQLRVIQAGHFDHPQAEAERQGTRAQQRAWFAS